MQFTSLSLMIAVGAALTTGQVFTQNKKQWAEWTQIECFFAFKNMIHSVVESNEGFETHF